ncbi:hypothetical protein [Streptomyces sp. 8N616]|uniref:hypothetical protein n=1 Tax=Streptomyces sp. 8N616 TaxID=3457414 RepID=UPI003FD5E750
MTDRPRLRKVVNVLVVCTAVVGIGWSGTELWTYAANRLAIDEACAGLVSPGKITALPYGEGRIEHNDSAIDLDTASGRCELFSTSAGEAADASKRMFFTASVAVEPEAATEETDPPWDTLVDRYDPTYLDHPLGGGIPGIVTDTGVGVKLPCAGGKKVQGSAVKNVVAGAVTTMDGFDPLGSGHQMDQNTRDRLASIAVDTANNLGAKLGCRDRLPSPPGGIPPVEGELIAPESAKGTCAWYAKSGLDSGDWMPDQVMETRADGDVWTEKCGLALRQDTARETWGKYAGKPGYEELAQRDAPRYEGDWWATAQSWFGESAKDVRIDEIGTETTAAEPGRAGRSPEAPVWWASSVCDGEPAVHTLTLRDSYALGAASRFEPVFRAYVADVAQRRGCTDVRFPKASAFTATFEES